MLTWKNPPYPLGDKGTLLRLFCSQFPIPYSLLFYEKTISTISQFVGHPLGQQYQY